MADALIANARMYAVAPGAAAAWKRLFTWLAEISGVPLTVIDHPFPAQLNDLWTRGDLGCAFMCGWPYLRMGLGHRMIAAPIPQAAYAAGKPRYCSHFVVRADSPFRTLADTFGHRFAFTIEDSHSGYNAPRHHLLAFRKDAATPLFREIVGPLTTPRRMLEAIVEGRTDVGPLDAFAYDLLSCHEPSLTAPTRIIASTAPVQIPAFVASAATPDTIVTALADALCGLGNDSSRACLRDDLCITGFARIDPADYAVAEDWARDAGQRGLEWIA